MKCSCSVCRGIFHKTPHTIHSYADKHISSVRHEQNLFFCRICVFGTKVAAAFPDGVLDDSEAHLHVMCESHPILITGRVCRGSSAPASCSSIQRQLLPKLCSLPGGTCVWFVLVSKCHWQQESPQCALQDLPQFKGSSPVQNEVLNVVSGSGFRPRPVRGLSATKTLLL